MMEEKRGGRFKVLCVDDSPVSLNLTKRTLEVGGYEVIAAQDGPEGLEKARQERPDAIILDIDMPGMDGFEVCQRLKEEPTTRQIPVIMLTATQDKKLTEKAFALGAVSCLTKPFRGEHLTNLVRLVLVSKRKG